MSELIHIKAKSQRGDIINLRVQEILEIDGQVYLHTTTLDQLAACLVDLQARVDELEKGVSNGG